MATTLEILQSATLCLAQSGTVKERLGQAYQIHLSTLRPEDLPSSLRAGFLELSAAMQRVKPLPRENPVMASIRKMSMEEASRHAVFVVRMLGTVAALGEAALPVSAPAAALVKAPVLPWRFAEAATERQPVPA